MVSGLRFALILGTVVIAQACRGGKEDSTGPDSDNVLPAPTGLVVAGYDTTAGAATLRWNKVERPDLGGYLVFRNERGLLNSVSLTSGLITDTLLRDTIFGDEEGVVTRNLEYRVQAIGRNPENRSPLSSPASLHAVSPATFITTLSWSEPNLIGDRAELGDTAILVLAWSNPTLAHHSLKWYRDGQAAPLRVVDSLNREGRDTLRMFFDSVGLERIRIDLEDGRGHVWQMAREYHVEAPPEGSGTQLTISAPGFKGNLVQIRDTLTFIARFSNPLRTQDSLAWYVDGGILPVRTRSHLGNAGEDTLLWSFDSTGQHGIRVEILDASKRRYAAEIPINASAILRVEPDSIERLIWVPFRLAVHRSLFELARLDGQADAFKVSAVRGGFSLDATNLLLSGDTIITGLIGGGTVPTSPLGPWDIRIEFPNGNGLQSPNAIRMAELRTPVIVALSPDSGRRGEMINLKITGHRIKFFQSTPLVQALFSEHGQNDVKFSGTVNADLPETHPYNPDDIAGALDDTAVVPVQIPADAALGEYDVLVRSNEEYPAHSVFLREWPLLRAEFKVVD
jgi:hypothetical protein